MLDAVPRLQLFQRTSAPRLLAGHLPNMAGMVPLLLCSIVAEIFPVRGIIESDELK